MVKGDGSVSPTYIFSLGVHIHEGIYFGAKSEGSRGESIGNDVTFHVGGGGPGGPGEVGAKFEGKATIQRAAAEESVGATVDSLGVDGNGDGKVLGGEFAEGDLIGKKGRDDILCTFS